MFFICYNKIIHYTQVIKMELRKEHKTNAVSQSMHLKADAFAKVTEIKSQDDAFPKFLESLYPDQKLENQYSAQNTEFKNQMEKLLKAIEVWGRENKLDEKRLNKVTGFCNHLFTVAGEQQPAIFYESIKHNLEKILFSLNNSTIPKPRRQSLLSELAENLSVCGPGLYLHIEAIRYMLENPISLANWLAELRTNIITSLAEKHVKQYNIEDGNSLHAHTAFLIHALKKGWNPLSNVTEINELFLQVAQVNPFILEIFETNFLDQFNLRAIRDFIRTSFSAELQRQLSEKSRIYPGWVLYNQKVVESLLKALHLNLKENIFDLEDKEVKEDKKSETKEIKKEEKENEAPFMRINAELFNLSFLKSCYEEDFLISRSSWVKEPVFGHENYSLIHPKDTVLADLAWIRNEKTQYMVYFWELTDEEKQNYYADCYSRFGIPDRFHLSQEKLNLATCFPTEESFAKFITKLDQDNTLIQNYLLFKELLRSNPNRLIEAFASIKIEKVIQLLDAMNVDYSLLNPQDALYDTIKTLPTLATKHGALAKVLSNRIYLVEEQRKAFKQLFQDEKKESASLFQETLFPISQLLEKADQATAKEQPIYFSLLTYYFPEEAKSVIPEKAAQAFKNAYKNKLQKLHPINYSELLQHASKATSAEQSLYFAFLKHYYPQLDHPSPENAAKAFKAAHEQSLKDVPERTRNLLNAVKLGNVQELKDAKLELKETRECSDKNPRSLAEWATCCQHQAVLDYFYSLAHTQYLAADFEAINHGAGLYHAPLLYWAALFNQQDSLSTLLALHDININQGREDGETALIVAARMGNIKVVQMLIDSKANVDIGYLLDVKPIYIAVQQGHLDVATYLLTHGANINAATNAGMTPIYNASHNGYLKVVKYLLTQGANVNSIMNNGTTPIYIASENGHLEVLKYLLNQNGNVKIARDDGATPIFIASQQGHLEIVKYLLNQGVSANMALSNGATLLYNAACNGHLEIIKLLLAQGANPTLRCENETPFDVASNHEIKNLLLSAELNFLLKEINSETKSDSKETKPAITFFGSASKEKRIAMTKALEALQEALSQKSSADSISKLKETHTVLSESPLNEYYNKLLSIAPAIGIELKR